MWDININGPDTPIYIAIVEALERGLESGRIKPGDRLPTHRSLAARLGVTVTTVTRAYTEAEKRGLVSGRVGRGTFAAEPRHGADQPPDYGSAPIEMGTASPCYHGEPDIHPLLGRILAQKDLNKLLKYKHPQGLPEHREAGVEWLRRCGLKTRADRVLVTAGPQHSLTTALLGLFQPGDCLAVSRLTSPGLISYARRTGLELAGVDNDGLGMRPDLLDSLCAARPVKGIYLAGNGQAPEHGSLPPARRQDLAEVMRRHGLILIEDDTFNYHQAGKIPPLAAFLPESSIYIAGVSAAFYSGLRVTFMHSAPRYYGLLSQSLADTILMVSPLCAAIVSECIQSGLADKIIRAKQKELDKRYKIFREKITDFPVSCAPDSIFAWLKLPDYWTGPEFEQAAGKSCLNVYAADRFTAGPQAAPNYIRIVLTGPEDLNRFSKGLDVLLAVLRRESGYVKILY